MVKKTNSAFWLVSFFATMLALTVVILGAYTRLKDAGLGCPDWPGCYGQLIVPKSTKALALAQTAFPHQPIESQKAWAEMTHRYFAGLLGLLIFIVAAVHIKRKIFNDRQTPIKIPLLLIGCVIFQALLGMWTVTWQLLPLVVMGHLLGGITITALLWWNTLEAKKLIHPAIPLSASQLKPWVLIGLSIVIVQIFLGGWTSANYASIVCPSFPFCQGHLFPDMDFHQAFNFLSPIGRNYQGGILGTTARVTIQMTHRYGAFITALYIGSLAFYLIANKKYQLHRLGLGLLFILYCQLSLGILNIQTQLSLPIAVMHNANALLLLLTLVTLFYFLPSNKKITDHVHLAVTNIAKVKNI